MKNLLKFYKLNEETLLSVKGGRDLDQCGINVLIDTMRELKVNGAMPQDVNNQVFDFYRDDKYLESRIIPSCKLR